MGESDFSCNRWCLGSRVPSSWIFCVGKPAQFRKLTSRATGGVSEVGLLAVGLSVWVRTIVSCTVWDPDFSCNRWCLGSWAPSSWILCVGKPAQFGSPKQFRNSTSHAAGGVLGVGLLAIGFSVWVRTKYDS